MRTVQKAREVAESDGYLTLPSKYDIHEYKIMEDFCYSIEDEELGYKLLDRIKGRGAFRRFKDAINFAGIEEDGTASAKMHLKGSPSIGSKSTESHTAGKHEISSALKAEFATRIGMKKIGSAARTTYSDESLKS